MFGRLAQAATRSRTRETEVAAGRAETAGPAETAGRAETDVRALPTVTPVPEPEAAPAHAGRDGLHIRGDGPPDVFADGAIADATAEATPVTTGRGRRPHIIVVGNEKGGTGKSTTCLHLCVALMRAGARVGTLDLDARQGTLSRYVANRRDFLEKTGLSLPQPMHRAVLRSDGPHRDLALAEDTEGFAEALAALGAASDFVIIDTPGADTQLSRLGHTYADTLITPMNDSYIDLDMLARLDPDTLEILGPSTYSEMVWDQRKRRMARDRRSIDWIVMRNRLSHVGARNKRDISAILDRLAKRIGFRTTPGFGERVIFRELFLKGLTLLDLKDVEPEGGLTMSHVAARQEVRALLDAIGLEKKAAVVATS